MRTAQRRRRTGIGHSLVGMFPLFSAFMEIFLYLFFGSRFGDGEFCSPKKVSLNKDNSVKKSRNAYIQVNFLVIIFSLSKIKLPNFSFTVCFLETITHSLSFLSPH